MNVKRMGVLFKREIRDILRDKKTMIMMVLLPLVLYPLLIVGVALLSTAIIQSQEEKTYIVAFEDCKELETQITAIFKENKEEIGYAVKVVEENSCVEAMESERIDAYVTMSGKEIKINYLSAKDRSVTASNVLDEALDIYKATLTKEQIEAAGLDAEEILNPISVAGKDLSTAEESVGSMIGMMMPFFIITMILLGAIYPAIDVTAGEKERGTLETLLTLPVTNFEMIMSKFLAVSCIACVSAILNVISMGGAMAFLVSSSLASAADMNIEFNFAVFLPGVLFTILVMMVFALFVTAVCMCTCVFAKNFKDANNYATPVMFIFMFAGYAPMLPDVELTVQTAAIPVVNVALLVAGLFEFNYNYALFGIVLASNVAYSLLAIMVLSRIYNSEAVLFSEGFSGVKLFDKRSEMKEKQMPGIGDCVLLMCVVLLLMLYGGTYAQLKLGFGGVAVQQIFILICPLVYAWYMKADAKKLFSFKAPKVKGVLGGIFLAFAGFLLALVVGALLTPVFPQSAESLQALDEMIKGQPVWIIILVMALMPAIGEELLFRGFLMGTLRERCRPCIAVVATTLIFAAYHMSLLKMFTISIVGLGLTAAAYMSGSIFVSMLMHFINNFLSVLISLYPEQVGKLFPVLMQESLGVTEIIIVTLIAMVSAIIGWLLLREKKKVQTEDV
ncbi:MAG: CPBP family intramembrane metalloprotease [Lachnospiraceae bacterium]|nr:CPBP family intramembrane metalloprotease [Lachnospiraceae bacterium]